MVDPAYNTGGSTNRSFNRTPEPYQPVEARQVPQPAVYPPSPSKPAPPPYTYSSDVYVPPSSPSASYQGSVITAGQGQGQMPPSPTSGYRSGQQQATMQQRSPSPMQERLDYETPVPQYTYRPPQQANDVRDKYPQGAPSRLLYSAPAAPAVTGYAQSRPMGSASPPGSPGAYGSGAPPSGRAGGYGQTAPRSGQTSPAYQPRYGQEPGEMQIKFCSI